MTQKMPIMVIDRESGESFEEAVLGEKWIRWAYQDSSSSLLERVLFRSTFLSKVMGWWYDSSLSKGKIGPVINELSIEMDEVIEPEGGFRSFNDFFVRKLKPQARPYSDHSQDLVSPADGRVLVFPTIDGDQFAPVKGHPFNLRKVLPGKADRFVNGSLAIIRLCPADYHRYHFPCAGEIIDYQYIPGALHSVNPIALASGPDVFGDNKRCYTFVKTGQFGTMCYIEVGAFGVGSIVNTCQSGRVDKMDEKGYFKFGGSTVILVFEPGRMRFSDDLVANSAKGMETLIKVGQPLGVAPV